MITSEQGRSGAEQVCPYLLPFMRLDNLAHISAGQLFARRPTAQRNLLRDSEARSKPIAYVRDYFASPEDFCHVVRT